MHTGTAQPLKSIFQAASLFLQGPGQPSLGSWTTWQ